MTKKNKGPSIKTLIERAGLKLQDFELIDKAGLIVKPFENKRATIISVDGSNGTGKTTLVKNLEAMFIKDNIPVSLMIESERNPFKKAKKEYEENLSLYGLNSANEEIIGMLHSLGRAHLMDLIESNGLRNIFQEGVVLYDRTYIDSFTHQLANYNKEMKDIVDEKLRVNAVIRKYKRFKDFIARNKNYYFVADGAIILLCDPELLKERIKKRYADEGRPVEKGVLEIVEEMELTSRELSVKIPNSFVLNTTSLSKEEVASKVGEYLVNLKIKEKYQ